MARRELQREIRSEEDLTLVWNWLRAFVIKGLQGGPVLVTLGRLRRTLDQNAKLWPMLEDVSKQCELVIDGEPTRASKEDWKDVFTAALKQHIRMAKGIDGGVVLLGLRTSRMDKHTFSELIELMYAYGAENGVVWSDPEEAKAMHEKAEKVLRKSA